MADPRINVILGARDDASKVVTGLRGQFAKFGDDAKKGFGIGAGIGAFSLLSRAVMGAIDAGVEFARMAAEEEAAVAQLTKSLEENAKGWDGNVEAIEEVITARQKLAFSDDEQRQTLAGLVSVTKDHTAALSLSRQAMDLARLKNIDLRTASELLGKVYAGNLGILSRYGIILKKGSTATEALAEIQRRAMGQAEAYAATSLGKWEALELKIADVKESIGAALLPAIDDLATGAEAALDPVGTLDLLFGVLQSNLEGGTVAFRATYEAMKEMAPALGVTDEQLRKMIQSADDMNMPFETFAARQRGRLKVFQDFRAEMEAQGHVFDELTATWKAGAKQIDLSPYQHAFDIIPQAVRDARKAALHETMKIGPSMRETIIENKATVRDAMMELRWAMEHPFAGNKYVKFLEGKQKQANKLLGKALREGKTDAVAEIVQFRAAVEAELAKLATDWTISIRAITQFAAIGTSVTAAMEGGKGGKGRAFGGPVDRGQTYLVGERGPELLHMGGNSGHVTKNSAIGGHGHAIYLNGRKVGDAVDERLGDSLSRSGNQYRSTG